MKPILSVITFLLLATWNFSGFCTDLKTGDLVFQAEGTSDFSNAIASATASEDSLKIIHAGIIEMDERGTPQVIEASPESGVRIISLEKFLEDSPQINGMPGVVVKRLNIDYSIDDAISLAKSHLGEEYDWWYLPDNGKMYCSELIYESYLTPEGEHVFESKPMNFRASDGSMPEFWTKLFEKLGQKVPEGVLGTNPNDLSKDFRLTEVARFF